MNAFQIVALMGSAAGLAMVLGGIWLVAKGVITLAATPATEALSIEWKKQFRLNTQVPGLAFFLVGLLFISVSLVFLKPADVTPIEFEGQITGVNADEQVSILVRPSNWELPGNSTGLISGKVYPDFSLLVLVISAPGFEPFSKPVKVNLEGQRIAKLGTVELKRKLKASELQKQIVPIAFDTPAPSAAAPAFGEAQ
jgi:hypothetical protein